MSARVGGLVPTLLSDLFFFLLIVLSLMLPVGTTSLESDTCWVYCFPSCHFHLPCTRDKHDAFPSLQPGNHLLLEWKLSVLVVSLMCVTVGCPVFFSFPPVPAVFFFVFVSGVALLLRVGTCARGGRDFAGLALNAGHRFKVIYLLLFLNAPEGPLPRVLHKGGRGDQVIDKYK